MINKKLIKQKKIQILKQKLEEATNKKVILQEASESEILMQKIIDLTEELAVSIKKVLNSEGIESDPRFKDFLDMKHNLESFKTILY